MDEVTKVSLNVWVDALEETHDKAHDELMDLEYADEGCTFYYEDQVWEIKNSCTSKIRFIINRMREVVNNESSKM